MPIAHQTAQRFDLTISRRIAVQYLLFLPANYGDRQGPRRWPLLLFLHGAGERGKDLTKVTVHGPPKIVQSQPAFPCIVVSPQCPNRQLWSNEVLLPLLDEIVARYRVDEARVYATGLSMGGYGTWNLALADPKRFAAIAPICGGGDIIPILLADAPRLRALKTLAIWAFHGEKDPVVPLRESERMVGVFKSIGNHARLTVYPGCGHDSWTQTYDDPALYRWLLAQRRTGIR